MTADRYGVRPEHRFESWTDLVTARPPVDAVIVATPDRLHAEPAAAFAELGYHILLEKPMAPTEDECRRIVDAVERSGVVLMVCHVLRYTAYTRRLEDLIASGRIGDIVSVQHLERSAGSTSSPGPASRTAPGIAAWTARSSGTAPTPRRRSISTACRTRIGTIGRSRSSVRRSRTHPSKQR
jgi:predicted dehydrogenase